MSKINRPKSNIARNAAMRNAKNRKDQLPAMPYIPYSAATAAWLDLFQPQYKTKFDAVSTARHAQTALTAQVTHAKKLAIYNEQDFVLALNKGIRREVFQKTDRNYYNIAVDDDKALKVSTESEVVDANDVLTTGETNRTAAGGAPISFPSISDVNAAVNNFIALNNAQAPAKQNYDTRQGELSVLNPEADRLILKLWNETETAFDTGDKPNMRRQAREWGVVYKPTAGETPSPEEFSISGKVTETSTGIKLGDVELKIVQTGNVYVSESDGTYFIPVLPPGTYTLEISKTDYTPKTITGVIVTAGSITKLDIELNPAVANGTISGTVKQTGMPVMGASVNVNGFPLLTATTDPMGNYSIHNVPAGMQSVMAKLPSPTMPPQTQNVNVMAGAEVNASFSF